MPRSFFALWPDEAVRRELSALAERMPVNAGRLVIPRNLHLTLVYLGPVDEVTLSRVRAAAAAIRAQPFALVLDHLGWWKRPRVIWVGAASVPAVLEDLASRLAVQAGAQGIAVDTRPYRPHLTISRKAGRPPPEVEFSPIHWKISEFSLVASRTLSTGADYAIIETWPLAGA